MSTEEHPQNPPSPADDATQQNHRQKGRLPVEYLTCWHRKRVFGRAVDLSLSGTRIFRKGNLPFKDDEVFDITLGWNDTQLDLKAKIAWSRKVGFRRYLLGLEFVDLQPESTRVLQHLGRVSKVSLWIASAEFEKGRNRIPFLNIIGRNGFTPNGNHQPPS